MKQRVRCMWHAESTPSLVRRKHDYYCYGACNRSYTLAEVAAKGVSLDYEEECEDPDDIQAKFDYIASLPRCEIRGLRLPADSGGYYVCWPEKTYYKYRQYDRKPKYIGPRGHTPPLFWVRKTGANELWITEGELNAMSLAKAVSGDVCSPGSASTFDKLVKKHLTEFKRYSSVNVVVDKDKAGIEALIAARSTFLYQIPFAKYYQLENDVNEILIEKGEEGLREELQRADYK